MKVRVIADKCQGHGRCFAIAPDLFDLDDYGMSSVIGDGTVPTEREAAVRLAVANCPEFAVELTETPTTEEPMPESTGYVPSPWEWVSNQVAEYEATGGTRANTLLDTGMPIIIVTTKGAKSSSIRKTPLMRVEHDGEYALVASMGGAPQHPVWYHNLLAHPDEVRVQDGPESSAVVIREVVGDEKTIWWERAVSAYPPYADYQAKTDRQIPVFIATRR